MIRSISTIHVTCFVAILCVTSGCSTFGDLNEPDEIKIAKTIKVNREKSNRLKREAGGFMLDFEDNDKAIPLLLKAEKLDFESRELSPDSAGPRADLGVCRSLLGWTYHFEYQILADKTNFEQSKRIEPKTNDSEQRDQVRREAINWVKKANAELEYYGRFLIQRFPNPEIYEQLAANYELLENYGRAEEMISLYLRTKPDISSKQRKALEAKMRIYRKKRLDNFEG